MTGGPLQASSFLSYPPGARDLAVKSLDTLREMPPGLLASQLREIRGFNLLFPAEQNRVREQLAYLRSLDDIDRRRLFAPLQVIQSPGGEDSASADQVVIAADPEGFLARYTALLWSSGKLDSFRAAAASFVDAIDRHRTPPALPAARLVLVVMGEGATDTSYPLFRKLLPFGTLFLNIRNPVFSAPLMQILASRIAAHPEPYAHWHIAGGVAWPMAQEQSSLATTLSYPQLDVMRLNTLKLMDEAIRLGWGPELLRDRMAQFDPSPSADTGRFSDPRMQAFAANILTQGSGTQIFSTTFVQWAAREALRRAEPLTLFCQYAPRQRQRPMNEMLAPIAEAPALDPNGSLIDADMAAWSTFLDVRRLPGAQAGLFLVWCQSRGQALLVAPGAAPGAQESSTVDLPALLDRALLPGSAVFTTPDSTSVSFGAL